MQYKLPINLDCFSCDPSDYVKLASWLQDQEYIGKKTKKLLISYAQGMQASMILRLEGKMLQAAYTEEKLIEVYRKIPKKYQW